MFFYACIIIGWILLVLLVLLFLKGASFTNSACTGNCRQGRDCTCMEPKNEKID
jgi:hypothetical protein